MYSTNFQRQSKKEQLEVDVSKVNSSQKKKRVIEVRKYDYSDVIKSKVFEKIPPAANSADSAAIAATASKTTAAVSHAWDSLLQSAQVPSSSASDIASLSKSASQILLPPSGEQQQQGPQQQHQEQQMCQQQQHMSTRSAAAAIPVPHGSMPNLGQTCHFGSGSQLLRAALVVNGTCLVLLFLSMYVCHACNRLDFFY